MQAAGHRFLFEPDAVLIHALPGWGFVADLRRNKGYDIMVQKTPRRYSAIPRAVFRRVKAGMFHCRRLGRGYFKWRNWPLAGVLALALPFWEIPGMFDAIRGAETVRETRFR